MKAIDRLKRDHKILRKKLDLLEAALGMGPASTWYILREICYTLSCQLKDHIRREEELVTSCREALSPEALAHSQIEHQDEPQLLGMLNHLFIEQGGRAMEQVGTILREVIPRLRRHMDEEEAEFFPAISLILGDREESGATGVTVHPGLREDMTVNQVLAMYPRARTVFSRLFVNIPFEGYDCLDEVAWRHGLESKDLLTWLGDVIAATAEVPQYRDRQVLIWQGRES